MYHSITRPALTICLAVIITGAFSLVVPTHATSSTLNSSDRTVLEEGVVQRVLRYQLPPSGKDLKEEPTSVEIYQHDETPLGSREPLLFVHGLRGEFTIGFRWTKVTSFMTADKTFTDKYKIFYARYNTHVPLNAVVPSFREAVAELYESAGNKPLTIVALSMGGNIVQEAMDDPAVAKIVDTVVAMGTPFHGSPLFSFDWMKYSYLKTYILPWTKLDRVLPYKMYFSRHNNLLTDLSWDDADRRIPNVGKFSTIFPWRFKGDLSPDTDGNPRILNINNDLKADKDKFITYGGYLLTRQAQDKGTNYVLSMCRWPYRFMTTTIPEHLAREHAVLRCLNDGIARAVPRRFEGDGVRYVYGLNDGITPLASALFLPSAALEDHTFNDESDIKRMSEFIDVRRARVFRNIDHLTFIDGWRPFGTSQKLKDEIDSNEEPRTIFQWLLSDLVNKDSQMVRAKQPIQTGTLPTVEQTEISD